MPIYKFIEYNSSYSNTTGSLWFYSKDEANNFDTDIMNTNAFKHFQCKTKVLGKTAVDAKKFNFRKCKNCSAIKRSK